MARARSAVSVSYYVARYDAPQKVERGTNWRYLGMEASEMSGPSPWTEERDEQLAAFWRDGLTTAEIGHRMGISKNSVIGRAHRLQLARRASPINVTLARPWTDEDDAFLRRVYGGFLTAAEIAARMGRSTHAIAYRASNLGLKAGRRASQKSRGMVSRPAARNPQELPVFEARAASPSRSRAATISGVSSAVERRASSLPVENLPGAVSETPPRRVFSHKQCQYITSSADRVHRFCEAPVVENAKGCASPYCAAHYAECYATPGKHANNPPPATWLKNRGMLWARG
jgi:GcrA cell cycle regulator